MKEIIQNSKDKFHLVSKVIKSLVEDMEILNERIKMLSVEFLNINKSVSSFNTSTADSKLKDYTEKLVALNSTMNLLKQSINNLNKAQYISINLLYNYSKSVSGAELYARYFSDGALLRLSEAFITSGLSARESSNDTGRFISTLSDTSNAIGSLMFILSNFGVRIAALSGPIAIVTAGLMGLIYLKSRAELETSTIERRYDKYQRLNSEIKELKNDIEYTEKFGNEPLNIDVNKISIVPPEKKPLESFSYIDYKKKEVTDGSILLLEKEKSDLTTEKLKQEIRLSAQKQNDLKISLSQFSVNGSISEQYYEQVDIFRNIIREVNANVSLAKLQKSLTKEVIELQLNYLELNRETVNTGRDEIENKENLIEYIKLQNDLQQKMIALTPLNLNGLEAKTILPESTEIIQSRTISKGSSNKAGKLEESTAFLKMQLGLIKSFEEAIPNLQSSFGGLFAAFVPPQGAADPFREFMKQIVLTFLNAVEIMLYEAGAASFFKAVLTGTVSLVKDTALIAAGLVALEAAKGFVGGFAKGTDSLHKTGYALVVEQGPELVYLNKGTRIFNNADTGKMLNNARANQPSSMNVNNVYIASSLDALSFFRVNYPKYKKFKSLQAV